EGDLAPGGRFAVGIPRAEVGHRAAGVADEIAPLLVEALAFAPAVECHGELVELRTKRLLITLRPLLVELLVADAVEGIGEDGKAGKRRDQLVGFGMAGGAQEERD